MRRAELDALHIPEAPLDVLAQQIVAEVASQDWREDDLFALVRRASPYAALTREAFLDVVRTLADGFSTVRGHQAAYVHRDAVNGMLRGRRGARLTALTSGGAIPDNADYDVVLEPAGQKVGTVNEDFAVESLAGDVFQLGNTSYRIRRVEAGRVRVEDAAGAAPTIPFWLGEAPGRTSELSDSVSRLRDTVSAALDRDGNRDDVVADVASSTGQSEGAIRQLVDYLSAARAALGALPNRSTLVIERFFDESGGMQLVLHSPHGSRINRAWGLALRKRFCVKFNFELQAAATEDAIVLSLSTSHSFPLADVARYLHSNTVRDVLVQAALASPMFAARWRWIASTSLALPRFRGGRKVPAPLQRMRAEDLMAVVFPDQIACAENIVGEREVPDHPLVRQAIHDCLHEAMDIDGLEQLLRDLEAGRIDVVARDLTSPSPLALEILTARPYAYLDDAPLEERRAQAVMARRWLDDASAAELGRLDVAAIEAVRAEAWPEAATADELHDALLGLGFLTHAEVAAGPGWSSLLDTLARDRRATSLALADGTLLWVAAERLPQLDALHPRAPRTPAIVAPAEFARVEWSVDDARLELLRSRLEGLGPVTVDALSRAAALPAADVVATLQRLASAGIAMEGRFTPGAADVEWCDRGLLARIHRYTVQRLRREIEPVATQDFMRFLFRWQHVAPGERRQGAEALNAVISQLQGFEAPAAAWEAELLPARLDDYEFTWLDELCLSGRAVWARLTLPASAANAASAPVRTTPITLLPRRTAARWTAMAPAPTEDVACGARALRVADHLRTHGASFFDEIVDATGMLRTEVEDALGELVAQGRVSSDSFAGLRALLTPSEKRKRFGAAKRRRTSLFGIEDAGRWSLHRRAAPDAAGAMPQDTVEHVVHALLQRYGVVFWRMLERESTWLPPWRDMLRVLRRLESRGDVRGGRFVAGVSGEQFALPEAVTLLRDTRRVPPHDEHVVVSGADPLNLVGTLLPGAKVPALTGNRILFRDGLPVAALVGGVVQPLATLEAADLARAESLLIARQGGAPLLAYLR